MPKELKNAKIDDEMLVPIEAMINSMTIEERARPQLINGSRRARIAKGSGTEPGEVTRLVKQFGDMQKMMKKMGMGGGGKKGKRGGLGALGGTRAAQHARHVRTRRDDGPTGPGRLQPTPLM